MGVAPDRLAVPPPVAGEGPARKLLARIPFALAEMQQRPGGKTVGEAAEQHAGQPPLLRPERQRVPLVAVHVVDRDEGRLATHGEPHVALADVALDRLADGEQRLPLCVGVRLGGARRLAHPRHRHVVREFHLGLLDRALDRRGARRLGRAGERDVSFASQQARGRVEADPARARQVDFAPGVEIGEVVARPLGPLQRLLVGHELDQVARGEARGETEVAQDGDQQPARVAARPLGERQRLLAVLHARLQANDIADLLLQPCIEADQEVDGRLLAAIDLGEPGRDQRSRRLHLAKGRDLLGQRGVVGEGPLLGLGLQEEVERIDHRHVGDQVDHDLEELGLFGEDQARQVVALRVLLPIDEMLRRLDGERVGHDGRAGVRRRTQPHDLRPERHGLVVSVGRSMMQRDLDAHADLLNSAIQYT